MNERHAPEPMATGDHDSAESRTSFKAGDNQQGRKLKPLAWAWRIISVISLLNIVGHAQSLVQISSSFHKIVLWWNYLTSRIFSFIHIHIPALERHALILGCIAFSAANIGHWKRYHRTLAQDYIAAMLNDSAAHRRAFSVNTISFSRVNREAISLLITLAVPAYLIVRYFDALWAKLLLAYMLIMPLLAAAAIMIIRTGNRRGSSPLLKKLGLALFSPALLLGIPLLGISTIAGYRKEIALTAGIVLGVILIDQLFYVTVDPLAGILNHIPDAPAS